jgi:hypothetical protein
MGRSPFASAASAISAVKNQSNAQGSDLVDGSGGGALVFSDDFPAISGDFVGKGRFKKAFLHRFEQVLFVFYHNGAVAG